MNLIPVKSLPNKVNMPHNTELGKIFEEFVNMNVKYAQISYSRLEYVSDISFHGSINGFLNRNPDLPIKVRSINGLAYLIRTDMETTE